MFFFSRKVVQLQSSGGTFNKPYWMEGKQNKKSTIKYLNDNAFTLQVQHV